MHAMSRHRPMRCRRRQGAAPSRRALGCAALLLAGASPQTNAGAHDYPADNNGDMRGDMRLVRRRKRPGQIRGIDGQGRFVDGLLSSVEDVRSHDVHVRLSDGEERRRLRQRESMYLPPAPVTPFRGGLKSVMDDDDADSSEDVNSVEAPSSDRTNDRDRGVNNYSTPQSSSSVSSGAVSSWAPEDYPDPWTNPILCGGAATASLMDEQHTDEQPYSLTELGFGKTPQQSEALMRRPLFCDPDRVLDREALRNVAMKLRDFAETFASTDVVQDVGVDFGADEEEDPSRDENEADDRNYSSDVIQGVDFGANAADDLLSKSVDSGDQALETTDKSREEELPEAHAPDEVGKSRMLFADHSSARTGSHPSRLLRMRIPEKQLYSDSVGGLFSTSRRDQLSQKEPVEQQRIEVAIALVQKINLPAILRADSYFFYSDQDDMVNDAAQYFARYIHDTWSKRLAEEQRARNVTQSSPTNIVLIFISTQDRICYISSGTRIAAVLPWWRLEHVVQDMKQDLRKGRTGEALNVAIEDLTALLLEGPPSFQDRVSDFFERFGIVMLFTVFTFVFATWGECRDRRKRLFFAERRSRMTVAEREKARMLQCDFKTKMCPICLEPFDRSPSHDTETESSSLDKPQDKERPESKQKQRMKRVDSLGIPMIGTDGEPIKLLRCGHIFDRTCWSMWVDSGHGNPWVCPVCRQDLGRPKRASQRSGSGVGNTEERLRDEAEHPTREDSSLFARIVATTSGPSMLLRPVTRTHPNYNSLQPRRTQRATPPFAPLSHPTMRRLHPMLGASMAPPLEEGLGEQTPLFAASNTSEDDDDY